MEVDALEALDKAVQIDPNLIDLPALEVEN